MTRGASPGRFDASIDVARAGLMLYVVAYLHLGGYVGDGNTHVGWASAAITQCALGTFTFISGYLLGRHPLKLEAAAWLAFYRQRFWPIYPLYLAALAFERLMQFDQPLHHWLALLCLALPTVVAVAVIAQYLYDRLFLSLSGFRTSSS